MTYEKFRKCCYSLNASGSLATTYVKWRKKHNAAENSSRILHYSEEYNGASNSYQYNTLTVAQVVGSQCAVSHVHSEQTFAITVQLICMNHCTHLLTHSMEQGPS